jgi:hypothetical protein
VRPNKYWPPVARADNVYGDRNLFCSCVPVEAYEPAGGAPEAADSAAGGALESVPGGERSGGNRTTVPV